MLTFLPTSAPAVPASHPHGTDRRAWLRRLQWYARRLKVMGAAEVVHRIVERGRLVSMRVSHELGWSRHHALKRHGGRPPLGFAFCSADTAQMPELSVVLPTETGEIEALLAGRLEVLGHVWTWRNDPDVWHEAPDSGKLWPRRFFDAIAYRPGNAIGDVRVTWEPSRLQHLVKLALVARECPDRRGEAVGMIESQLRTWVDANPPWTGVHYISAMECGLRVIAVCFALDLVRAWLREPDRSWGCLLTLVDSHAGLIERRVSAHSSEGNHTAAEAVGLLYAGLLFEELPGSARRVREGLAILQRVAARQVLRDGGGVEQSFWYLRFLRDLIALAVALLEQRGTAVPAVLAAARERATDFLTTMEMDGERLPRIGDEDSGHALISWRPQRPRPLPWADETRVRPEAGYTIMRAARDRSVTAIFDHGPLGMPPCHGHGHADALSFTVSVGHEEVLVDPGTYSYGACEKRRAYFRSTAAHNTVAVNGVDQAVQEGSFLWSAPYRTQVARRMDMRGGGHVVLAWHDGYERRFGVRHWRAVWFAPESGWLVWDCLTGAGEHDLALHWHIRGTVTERDGAVAVDTASGGFLMHVGGGRLTRHCGDPAELSGWWSPTYGRLEPLTTMRAEVRATLPHEFLTCIGLPGGRGGTEGPDPGLLRRWVRETQTR